MPQSLFLLLIVLSYIIVLEVVVRFKKIEKPKYGPHGGKGGLQIFWGANISFFVRKNPCEVSEL